MSNKIIITCATTGSVHTPTMSPHLPFAPADIAEQSIAAAEAGAAILHLHARDPDTGKPTPDPDVFMQFLPQIYNGCDAVLNITTGGSAIMSLDERLAAPMQVQPEMCSLNLGSMNFGLFPMQRRYKEWKHDWEPEFLEGTRDMIFKNTFADIERILHQIGDQFGTRFEFECYDAGHIQTLAFMLREGLAQKPLFVQFVLGILGGIDASPEQLMHMKATADRLLGDDYQFSVLAAGNMQMKLGTMSTILGGNVRVGLEDSLWIGRGQLAANNAEQVRKIRTILEEMGHEIATPDEARDMLHLKGADKVNL